MTAKLARPVKASDFVGVPPDVTKVPAFLDGENHIVYAFGHIEPDAMVEAVYNILEFFDRLENGSSISTQDVKHGFAKILIPENHPEPVYNFEDEDTSFITCSSRDKDAFPITQWQA